ncbi:DUF2255 family protein [Phytohabitans kaempferiae]|uniref:DUF2255 family protein n=1 Tax=Phytohabitans kaempferiae TaxID=1620943 RepID=A0ABV6M962_9ACTN
MVGDNAVDYLARTDTVRIATELRDGGEVVTPIWAVVVDGVPYVRSGYGDTSKWYRRVRRTGRATFVDGRQRYPASVEAVHDERAIARVDEAFRAKYARYGGPLRAMLAPEVRGYTMRVTPR